MAFSFNSPSYAAEPKGENISPSITYMFESALHGCLISLRSIKNEEELKTQLHVARQTYLLCYAYWYMVNVEKISILDKRRETTVSSLLRHLKKFNFDIRSDLTLIRIGNEGPLAEKDLKALHSFSKFPCNVSDFVSDEKYSQLADDFVTWTKELIEKK